jgi:lysophospholipase L1-like esterase
VTNSIDRPSQTIATPRSFERYVALGDSYTAAPLVPQMDIARGCLRSERNYPALVAAAVAPSEFIDRSCSAADTTDLTAVQHTETARVRPQFASLTKGTDLVTLGMGGNDFAVFATLVTDCVALRPQDPTGSPCREAMEVRGRDRLLTALRRTQRRVTAALAGIQRRSPEATVLVVGYPQLVPADGTCPRLLPLADGDYDYARRVSRRLTGVLEQASAAAGAAYVDVWTASAGHDICSHSPWINGRFTDFSRAAAYHPLAVEQAAVADLIGTALASQP